MIATVVMVEELVSLSGFFDSRCLPMDRTERVGSNEANPIGSPTRNRGRILGYTDSLA